MVVCLLQKSFIKWTFFYWLLSGCNPHQQSKSSLCAWKSSLTQLFAGDVVENDSHLSDVTSSGSSVPSPVKTKPLYCGPFGNFLMLLWATRLSFQSHHLQGRLRSVGTGSPPAPWYLLSPNSARHSPAALRDAEHIPVCCYLLLQCTYTQQKSPFIHLQAFHLLPRPTPAFTS